MTDSRLIHVTTADSVAFLFMSGQYSTVCVSHGFRIPSSADGHLGCFREAPFFKGLFVYAELQAQ